MENIENLQHSKEGQEDPPFKSFKIPKSKQHQHQRKFRGLSEESRISTSLLDFETSLAELGAYLAFDVFEELPKIVQQLFVVCHELNRTFTTVGYQPTTNAALFRNFYMRTQEMDVESSNIVHQPKMLFTRESRPDLFKDHKLLVQEYTNALTQPKHQRSRLMRQVLCQILENQQAFDKFKAVGFEKFSGDLHFVMDCKRLRKSINIIINDSIIRHLKPNPKYWV